MSASAVAKRAVEARFNNGEIGLAEYLRVLDSLECPTKEQLQAELLEIERENSDLVHRMRGGHVSENEIRAVSQQISARRSVAEQRLEALLRAAAAQQEAVQRDELRMAALNGVANRVLVGDGVGGSLLEGTLTVTQRVRGLIEVKVEFKLNVYVGVVNGRLLDLCDKQFDCQFGADNQQITLMCRNSAIIALQQGVILRPPAPLPTTEPPAFGSDRVVPQEQPPESLLRAHPGLEAKLAVVCGQNLDTHQLVWLFNLADGSNRLQNIRYKQSAKDVVFLFKYGDSVGGHFLKAPLVTDGWMTDPASRLFRIKNDGELEMSSNSGIYNLNINSNHTQHGYYDIYVHNNTMKFTSSGTFHYPFAGNQPIFGVSDVMLSHYQMFEWRALEYTKSWMALELTAPRTTAVMGNVLQRLQLLPIGIERLNVVLIGPPGGGKSSFVNSVQTVLSGSYQPLTVVGTVQGSLTLEYNEHTLETATGARLPLRLCDTRGWENAAYQNGEMDMLLRGHLSSGMPLTQVITPQTLGYIPVPTPSQRIHCVVIVLPATSADAVQLGKARDMVEKARLLKLRAICLLTYVDRRFERDLRRDLTLLSYCKGLEVLRQHVSAATSLALGDVFFTTNLESHIGISSPAAALVAESLSMIVTQAHMAAKKMVE
jgi:hypothetical protein